MNIVSIAFRVFSIMLVNRWIGHLYYLSPDTKPSIDVKRLTLNESALKEGNC
jgi:hypothetical protein